jgi:hypothetical protein
MSRLIRPQQKVDAAGLSSDHFLNVGDECFMMHNNTYSERCNVSVFDTANYDGIAMSCFYGKILYNVLSERYHDKLMSQDLQVGF